MQNKIYDYQWEFLRENSVPKAEISKWSSRFGPKILNRDDKGYASKVRFNLLFMNPKERVYIVGDFNDWGNDRIDDFEMKSDSEKVFSFIDSDCIKHKDKYKFLVKGKDYSYFIQDPAGVYFDDMGNTIFWDFDDPDSYKQKFDFIDSFNRSVKILQTDLPGLIVHFSNREGVCGRDISKKSYYRFIAESGVIDEIKKLGFNTVQFLPFAQSIDGSNWKLRYLVPFQFAIQKNWGNPDDFAYMVDMFHKAGIAVIGDFVLGHLPHKDFEIFGQSFKQHGIHHWKKSDGNYLYLKEETSWGTMRLDYDNIFVREFFVSSCLHFMKHYKIDGFRIDNVDGIIRYGPNGDGDERPNGRTFLRELNSSIYNYNPSAIINFEAHYFFEDNAKMLVAPIDSNLRALGASAYNSSRLTYFFHKDYMLKSADKISIWRMKHIAEEKEWGRSNSTVADFHNHDAAAGLMDQRCTGAYAYDCMTVDSKSNHIHALGKIKVMEAFISFGCEGRTLDLMQTFLLQSGTFEHDSSIQWFLTFNEVSRNLLNYKKRINNLLDDEAFWPSNTKNREFLNVDDKNKVIVIKRESEDDEYVIVINASSWILEEYKVGTKGKDDYEVIFNSDSFDYAGFGIGNYHGILKNRESSNFEVLDREVVLHILAPYGVVVLKKIK